MWTTRNMPTPGFEAVCLRGGYRIYFRRSRHPAAMALSCILGPLIFLILTLIFAGGWVFPGLIVLTGCAIFVLLRRVGSVEIRPDAVVSGATSLPVAAIQGVFIKVPGRPAVAALRTAPDGRFTVRFEQGQPVFPGTRGLAAQSGRGRGLMIRVAPRALIRTVDAANHQIGVISGDTCVIVARGLSHDFSHLLFQQVIAVLNEINIAPAPDGPVGR